MTLDEAATEIPFTIMWRNTPEYVTVLYCTFPNIQSAQEYITAKGIEHKKVAGTQKGGKEHKKVAGTENQSSRESRATL